MDLDRRIVVALPPVGEAAWSGIGPVGVLRYREAGSSKLAVVVRVVSPWPEVGQPLLPGIPFPATTDIAFHRAFAPLTAREMVPRKGSCDVGFAGRVPARESDGTATPLAIEIGAEKRSFKVTVPNGVDVAELRAELVSGGSARLGHGDLKPFVDGQSFDEETEVDATRSVEPALRFPFPAVGDPIKVVSDWVSLDTTLGFELFIRVDYLDDTISLPPARCDAITIDVAERRVEWIFRGIAVDPAEGREIERVVVSAFAAGQDELKARVDAWLPHAAFLHAARARDVERGEHPGPLDESDLAMARYSTWDVGPAASTIPIEEVAQIQVELLRGRNRAEVLAAHDLDDYRWSVEERAAAERLAEGGAAMIGDEDVDPERAPADGEGDQENRDLATRYRKAYDQAMADTAYVGKILELDAYAAIRAAMEVRNPVRVLERAALTVAEFISVEMSMQSRFEADAAEHAKYEASYAAALARLEAEGPNEDDFEPPGAAGDEEGEA